jgi:hypothetical protein
MHRGWLDHPMLGRERYCNRAAWVWLVERAEWNCRDVNIRGEIIILRRGQLVASQRYLATAWKWSRGKVERFLTMLEIEGAIERAIEPGETVITICNYDKYQANPNRTEPPTEPIPSHPLNENRATNRASKTQSDFALAPDGEPANEPAPSHRQGQKGKKDKEGNFAAPSGAASSNGEFELFERGKSILGNSSGGLIAKLLKTKNGDVALARSAIEMASTKQSPREYIGAILRRMQADDPTHDPFMPQTSEANGIVHYPDDYDGGTYSTFDMSEDEGNELPREKRH